MNGDFKIEELSIFIEGKVLIWERRKVKWSRMRMKNWFKWEIWLIKRIFIWG